MPRGRAVGVRGLEPAPAAPKLAKLHRPVPPSLSCVDTGQASGAHSLGLERGRGRPWAFESRTVRTHSGSPPAASSSFTREAPRPVEAPAVDAGGWWASQPRPPSTMPHSHCSACPRGQGSAWVLQQLIVLTPGKWGPGYQGGPPDHHHSPGLSTSEGPEPMVPGRLGAVPRVALSGPGSPCARGSQGPWGDRQGLRTEERSPRHATVQEGGMLVGRGCVGAVHAVGA